MRSSVVPRLREIGLQVATPPLPADVAALLDEADRRAAHFENDDSQARVPAYVGSNWRTAYGALRAIADRGLSPGPRFCEWGSGLGVVTCLAAMVGFDATGIEIESRLVTAARRLADDFALPARLVEGSYKPDGLHTETVDASRLDSQLGFSPTDFDLVFAYPWPAEEKWVVRLFEDFGNDGALLLTYHGGGRLKLRQRQADNVR